jgi:putative transposase
MKPPNLYHRHRFPAEIISHAVWLYYLFSLSLRDVELILAERGVPLSYETVRRWCQKFGRSFAERLRKRRPGLATAGIWTRSSSAFEASYITSGVRWIRTVRFSTSWSRIGAMPKPPSGFSSDC